MKKKLPVYDVQVSESELNKSGVSFIALVDDPAVQMDFQYFEKHEPIKMVFVSNDEQRIVTGVLMRADFPIYRNDESRGEYYVKFSGDTIKSIVKKFAKMGHFNNVNLMHSPDHQVDGVYMIESFIVDSNRGILPPKGMKVEDGSWIGSYYVENQQVWDQIKAGTFLGFSVEGLFGYEFSNQDKTIEELISLISKHF